jgi:hypothetical protein
MTRLTRIRAELADVRALLDAEDQDREVKPIRTAEGRAEAAKLYRRSADMRLDLYRRLELVQAELDEFPPGPTS